MAVCRQRIVWPALLIDLVVRGLGWQQGVVFFIHWPFPLHLLTMLIGVDKHDIVGVNQVYCREPGLIFIIQRAAGVT